MNTTKNYKEHIRLIIADVDGTLTDGGIYITDSGDQFRKFNTKDGLAIRQLIKKGYIVGFITASFTEGAIRKRAEMLGVQKLYIGSDNKLEILDQWCKELQITFDQVAFVGDDIIDEEIMMNVGLSACPSDAVAAIKKVATMTLEAKGGEACFREFAIHFFDIR